MYLVKTPRFIQSLDSHVFWRIPSVENTLYLTFDDGPHPEVTPKVLSVLQAHKAKGTFFCVGNNARCHPAILKDIQDAGHQLANHSHKHESGFETNNYNYYKSFLTAKRYLDSTLFRPPYGRITPQQAQMLSKKTNIIMWDVLSGDFDKKITWEKCAANVIQNAQPGSIIVFHDSAKAAPRMLPALERVLNHFGEKGFKFEPINPFKLNRTKGK